MSFSTFFGGLCVALLVAGCDSDVTTPQGGDDPGGGPPITGGNGGDGGSAGAPIVGGNGGEPEGGAPPVNPDGQPPEPPMNAPPGDGSAPRVFAVDHLYVGTKTTAGVESADAWKSFGYDVDKIETLSDYSNHCTPAGGAAPNNVFPDGLNGIDNAFGKVLVPILKTAASTQTNDFEASVNEPIVDGDFTLVFDVTSLGAAANYSLLPSSYFEGRDRNDITWNKAPESFNLGIPLLAFPEAYSTNDVWVSRRVDGVLPVKLLVAGAPLVLKIHVPLVSAEMAADHDTVTRGIISGVLDTEELIADLNVMLGALEPSFCDGAAVEGILNQIRQASDLMSDGTNSQGQECNGISVGLGFTATSAIAGAFGTPEPPFVDPCE